MSDIQLNLSKQEIELYLENYVQLKAELILESVSLDSNSKKYRKILQRIKFIERAQQMLLMWFVMSD